MHTTKQINGFTLFEMIIGLSILSILTVYAIPNYQTFKQNSNMTHELNRLVRTINFARNQSIHLSQHTVLCASQSLTDCDGQSQWHLGWLVFADINRNKKYDATDQLLLTEQKMKTELKAVSSQFRSKIRFDRTGFSPGTNLTIRLCDHRGEVSGKSIVVSNVGRPRVTKKINRCG